MCERIGRNHIRYVHAVTAFAAVGVALPFVVVVNAVVPAVEIVLIIAPRHAGHEVNNVTRLSPLFHAFLEIVEAVDHNEVGLNVKDRV